MVLEPLESAAPRTLGSTSSQANPGHRTAEHSFAAHRGGARRPHRGCFYFCTQSAVLYPEDSRRATATRGCDGHNDCGAGCLRVWSLAHCDPPQPVLLPAVLLARRTNCGLFLGGKCGEQTRRHGRTEVKDTNKPRTTFTFSRSLRSACTSAETSARSAFRACLLTTFKEQLWHRSACSKYTIGHFPSIPVLLLAPRRSAGCGSFGKWRLFGAPRKVCPLQSSHWRAYFCCVLVF